MWLLPNLTEAARLYAKAKKGVILISTGQNSGKQDPALAQAAVNLALLTGKIGKESCGVFVLGEKNNAQGALDMGMTPGFLPGYGDIKDAAERSRFEKVWNLPIPVQPGMNGLAILQAIEERKITGLYLAGENPLVTYPDSARTQKALSSLDFLVVQDCFLTDTASLAHVVLPAVTFAEKEGTFTNVERRVQRVRQALAPAGQAKSDLWIFQSLAKEMGVKLGATSAQAVNDEIRSLVPLYGGISYARLDSSENPAGLQWPCPSSDHPGTSILYGNDFPRGKGKFIPVEFEEEPGQDRFFLRPHDRADDVPFGLFVYPEPGTRPAAGRELCVGPSFGCPEPRPDRWPEGKSGIQAGEDYGQGIHLRKGRPRRSLCSLPFWEWGEPADRVGFADDPGEASKRLTLPLFNIFTAEVAESAESDEFKKRHQKNELGSLVLVIQLLSAISAFSAVNASRKRTQ